MRADSCQFLISAQSTITSTKSRSLRRFTWIMVEHLTSALKAMLEKDDLSAVISALESAAPTSRQRKDAEAGEKYK